MTPDPTPQTEPISPAVMAAAEVGLSQPVSDGGLEPVFDDPTPQPAHDHGSAGFCGNHVQAADRPTAAVEAVEAGAIRRRVEYAISHGAVNHDLLRTLLDALTARDAEIERLTGEAEVGRQRRRADIAGQVTR